MPTQPTLILIDQLIRIDLIGEYIYNKYASPIMACMHYKTNYIGKRPPAACVYTSHDHMHDSKRCATLVCVGTCIIGHGDGEMKFLN